MTQKLLAFITLVWKRHLACQAHNLNSQTMVMLFKTILASSISICLHQSKLQRNYKRNNNRTPINWSTLTHAAPISEQKSSTKHN